MAPSYKTWQNLPVARKTIIAGFTPRPANEGRPHLVAVVAFDGVELLHRGEDRAASRDTRELEAEAVACVVGQAVGIESVSAARDYIHLYRGDREALTSSLDHIQHAASQILRAIEVGG
jgi:hypothetical protein